MRARIGMGCLLVAIGSLAGSAARAGAVDAPGTFLAVDANGRTLGQVVREHLGSVQVARVVEGKRVMIEVAESAISDSTRPIVYFGGGDCEGSAYLSVAGIDLGAGAPTAVAGGWLYFGEEAEPLGIAPQSVLVESECRAFGAQVSVVPARPVANLAAEFTPPFSVVAAPSRGDDPVTPDPVRAPGARAARQLGRK